MGNSKNEEDLKSRRWFLSLFTSTGKQTENPEMVKILTADGKIVEIKKSVLEQATQKKKSSNKEICDWMKNPSKENNS